MTLSTSAHLTRYLSQYGILAWTDHDQDGVADTNVLADCQTYGYSFVVGRLVHRYTAAAMAQAPILIEVEVIVTLRELCVRRGLPPPASLEFRYQEIAGEGGLLDQIVSGRMMMVDASGNPIRPTVTGAPSHSNLMVDRGFSERRIRVVTGQSNTDQSRVRRDLDRFWEHDVW